MRQSQEEEKWVFPAWPGPAYPPCPPTYPPSLPGQEVGGDPTHPAGSLFALDLAPVVVQGWLCS